MKISRTMRLLLLFAIFGAVGPLCDQHAAAARAASAAPPQLSPGAPAGAIDPLPLLQEYLRIDTSNPPGNEMKTARFLEALLARDGITSEIIEIAPGRADLIA